MPYTRHKKLSSSIVRNVYLLLIGMVAEHMQAIMQNCTPLSFKIVSPSEELLYIKLQ